MRYVGITLAVLTVMVMWCAQGFAAKDITEYQPYIHPKFLGTPSVVRNPAAPLAPAGASRLTPAEFRALEQAKAARNPMSISNPQAGKAGTNLAAKTPVGFTGKEVQPPYQPPRPFWGTNTTVWTGPLAGNVSGRNNRPTSFDFDTSGNFYVVFDSADGTTRVLGSSDQGQTWNWLWQMSTGGGAVTQSKLIVENVDSLFFYVFAVDAAGQAVAFRLNQSGGYGSIYTLRADSSVSIDAAWDIDRVVPWIHVAIEKTGAENNYQIQYVRGTQRGTAWSAPSFVVYNSTYPCIATGNVGYYTNNIFIGSTWNAFSDLDSSAHVSIDSAGTWVWKKVGGDFDRKETETAIAATHGSGSDSVRVWVTDTHYNSNVYPMIYYAYNLYNGQGAWTMNQPLPGASDITRTYWGSSINIPNWEFSGLGSFVNVSWYADSTGINKVRQSWIGNGWSYPTGWNTATEINDHNHDTPNASLSYATGARRASGSLWSVVIYPGFGPTNVYMNGFWFNGVEAGPANFTPKGDFELASARPNPLTRSTSIAFSLPKSGNVELAVYDIAGRKFATLAKGQMSAGSHEVNWNGANAPAGVYLYRLNFEGKTLTNRMVVVR